MNYLFSFPEHLNSPENVFISVKSCLALDQNMIFSYLFQSESLYNVFLTC